MTNNIRVLVTGGTTGIGLATAKAFAAQGATVIATGLDAARVAAAGAETTGVRFVRSDAGSDADVAAQVRLPRAHRQRVLEEAGDVGRAVERAAGLGLEVDVHARRANATARVACPICSASACLPTPTCLRALRSPLRLPMPTPATF